MFASTTRCGLTQALWRGAPPRVDEKYGMPPSPGIALFLCSGAHGEWLNPPFSARLAIDVKHRRKIVQRAFRFDGDQGFIWQAGHGFPKIPDSQVFLFHVFLILSCLSAITIRSSRARFAVSARFEVAGSGPA